MDIPKDKNYPAGAGQCDDCGGHGCGTCGQKGWLLPFSETEASALKLMGQPSDHVRRCENPDCKNVIPPNQVAVYCSNECAAEDA